MGASDVQIQIIGRDLTSSVLRQVDSSIMRTTQNLSSLGGAITTVNRTFANAAGVAAGIAGYQGAAALLQQTMGSAVSFAKNLETSEIAMGGILVSMTEVNGRSLEWGEALQISKGIIAKLNDEALRTAATSEELVFAFQAILGPALRAKMTIKEMIDFTVTATNAVKSIFPGNQEKQRQIVQELRDLVAGGIQPASSTLANALGLKDSDIKAAKESSEGLFKFLMDRLKGFEISAPAYAKTWTGITEQIQEAVARIGGTGLAPAFSGVKETLNDVVGYLAIVDDTTKQVSLNPELISGLNEAASTAVTFGREMKEVGTTVGTVVAPAASVAAGAVKLIAEHAAMVTYALGGWMILSNVSAIYTDITAVTAGATAANTMLGGAVLNVRNAYLAKQQAAEAGAIVEIAAAKAAASGNYALANQLLYCREHYLALGIAAEKAAAMQVEAALHAAAGNQKLAQTIMAQNMAYAQSAVVADAAALKQVRGAAAARSAVQSTLGTIWALAGGWAGVAVATGLATAALIEYLDTKNKVESYNSKAEVYEEDGRLYKKVRKDIQTNSLEYGPQTITTYEKQELSPAEYREHYDWKNWRARTENQKPWNQDVEDLIKDITSKFAGGGDEKAAKKAERAYEEAQKLNDKIADMMARMNVKIAGETTTVFETASMKVKEEIANMKRDLDRSAIDFAKYGIDVSEVLALMNTYEKEMMAKAERIRSRAFIGMVADTAKIQAGTSGDTAAEAEADYRATMAKIQEARENDELFKKTARGPNDQEARAAADANYSAQEKAALKKRNDQVRDARLEDFERAVEHNSMLLVLENRSQAAVDELNRRILNAKIGYLDEEITKAREGSQERIRLEREKYETILQLEEIASRDITQAVDIALKRRAREYTDWADEVKSAMNDLDDSMIDNFARVIRGAQTFSDAYKNIWDTLITDLSNLIVKKWYEQTLKKYMEQLSGDIIGSLLGTSPTGISAAENAEIDAVAATIPGNATGTDYWRGGLTWVGEREPELLNLPRGTSITPLSKIPAASAASAPSVSVKLINNTGKEAKATAQAGWDHETQTMVISLLLDGIDRNVEGSRDYFSSLKSG